MSFLMFAITKNERDLKRMVVNNTPEGIRTLISFAGLNSFKSQFIMEMMFKAVYNENIGIIREFVAAGVDINSRDGLRQSTVLMLAVTESINNAELIKGLLELGAEVNGKYWQNGTSILEMAMDSGLSTESMKLLIDYGANLEQKDNEGFTPLLYAASSYHANPEKVKLILEAGADVNSEAKDGKTALDFALEGRDEKTIEILKAAGGRSNFQQKPLWRRFLLLIILVSLTVILGIIAIIIM